MKILVIAESGSMLGIAQRLAHEGHQVTVFPTGMKLVHTGDNLYSVSPNLWKCIQECKFIVAECGWDKLYERAKTYNKPIIGASAMTDMLNTDSVKEFKLGAKLGISFPKTEVFNDVGGLQPKVLAGDLTRYYVKHGRRTFVCTKPEWLAWAMYQLPVGKDVLLQEEVQGEELSVIGWFNGLNWVRPFFYATPYADRLGGVVMLAQKSKIKNKLTDDTITPLGEWLKVIDYKGPVTAHLIGNGDKTYVKRFELGLTAPCVFAMLEGLKEMPLTDFFNALAFGSDRQVDVSNDYLVGISVSSRESDMHGAPLLGVDEGNLSKIFLQGVFKNEIDGFMLSGETEEVYTAVSHGRDLKEASRRVYGTINNVKFPRMYYMSNIQGQSSKTFGSLRSWGII
jgi:hypothetical protein